MVAASRDQQSGIGAAVPVLQFDHVDAVGCFTRHVPGQERYPVLKTEWCEAVTLSSWLDDNHADRFAVGRLADRFEALTRDLTENGVAHGDLQHGNLLVASDDSARVCPSPPP